jgi:LmbE family N-acetylglucosaminyl deacetylase
MNPYHQFVSQFARIVQDGKSLPLGGLPPTTRPPLAPDAPKVLFFAPHPDDETIIGGLALRLLREARWNVLNVAVTQGSKKERQAERLIELRAACDHLGFGLLQTAPNGLEKVSVTTREKEPLLWSQMVKVIAGILAEHQPRVILFPHQLDWNGTHIGVHFLIMDALKSLPPDFSCFLVETEFWGQMQSPNLMVEYSSDCVADLVAATSFHVGEVKRNPYHLLIPAWMQDNVRRGAELVGGQGQAAPDFSFAQLYRLQKWKQSQVEPLFSGGRTLPASVHAGSLFSEL